LAYPKVRPSRNLPNDQSGPCTSQILQLLLDKSGCLLFESLTSTAISQNNFIYGDLTRIRHTPPKLLYHINWLFLVRIRDPEDGKLEFTFYSIFVISDGVSGANPLTVVANWRGQPSIGRQFYAVETFEGGHYVSAMNQDLQTKGSRSTEATTCCATNCSI
jgi:hypothetical protein